ncbi:MAG: polysaccharide biosynthesis tyrosine autokinase [Actinomycetota bacterium]
MPLEPRAGGAEQAPTLRDYLEVLRRRKWIIAFFTCLVVGAAAAYTFTRTPIYEAEAQVLVQPFSLDADADANPEDVSLETEALIATSPSVAEIAAEDVEEEDFISLGNNLEVSVADDASVLIFDYAHRNPKEAARRAQAFAQAYVDNRTEQAQDRLDTVASSIQDQIDALQGQLDDVQSQIAAVEAEEAAAIEAGEEPADGADTGALVDEANTLSQQIAFERTKLFSLASPRTLEVGRVLFRAEVPGTPSSPTPVTNLLVALLVGLAGGVGLAFLSERLDERLSGRADLESASGVPVLTLVPHITGWRQGEDPYLVTHEEPHSVASEAYRTLRTAILFASSQSEIKTLMIASANEQEGKTVTSANLAVVLGQTGKKVVVVSGDLRKPRLHDYFGVRPRKGLTNVLAGEAEVGRVMRPVGPSPDNVKLLSSGPIPGNPAELLGSETMVNLLEELRGSADFVLVDSAPVLAVADAMIVARACDAVVLVADASKTKHGAVRQARVQLDQVDARVIGSILNNFDPSKTHAYESYASSSYAYKLDEPSRRQLGRLAARPWSKQKG